jgi:hypothetical protein
MAPARGGCSEISRSSKCRSNNENPGVYTYTQLCLNKYLYLHDYMDIYIFISIYQDPANVDQIMKIQVHINVNNCMYVIICLRLYVYICTYICIFISVYQDPANADQIMSIQVCLYIFICLCLYMYIYI